MRDDTDAVSDARLVDRVRAGDTSAFSTLYRSYAPEVGRAVRTRLHDPESVADAVQETFTRALEQLDGLRDTSRFRPWLLAIGKNTAVDQLRLRAKSTHLDEDDDATESSEPGPEAVAEVRELARLVSGCVAGLSSRDATAVTLVADLGFSPAEVADALGVTRGTAKVIVHRARRRLRDRLSVELLVRRRAGTCPALSARYEADGLLSAAEHVRSCPACTEMTHGEVRLYDARPAGPLPTEGDPNLEPVPSWRGPC